MNSEALHDVANYRHGRVPRAVRERQIIALAEQLFAERGYQRTSMDELARRAGVTKPVIYDLVGSKDELHRRLFEQAADELAESVTAAVAAHPEDLADQLRAGATAFFGFIDKHRAAWAMLFTDEAGGPHASHVKEIRVRQTRLVSGWLAARAAQHGRPVDDGLVEAAAHVLNGAFEWLAHWWRDNPSLTEGELVDAIVALLYPGMARLTGDDEAAA